MPIYTDVTPSQRGSATGDCRICEKLLSWFLDPPQINKRGKSEAYFGEIQKIRLYDGSRCSQHTTIIKHMRTRLEEYLRLDHWELTDIDVSRHHKSRTASVSVNYDYEGVWVGGSLSGVNKRTPLVLADNPKARERHGDVRVLDQEWVDLNIINRWIDDCSKSHGEKCENPMRVAQVVPDLLVDVKRRCIVEGKQSHKYMALSYRLGNAAPFRLGPRDLNTLRKDSVLEDAQILNRLPLTVRHAMLLADELGFDYLWTDVLCNLHEGPATLADQLNKMSAKYASAVITVVAADGDGADGISGLRGVSAPREPLQVVFAICDEFLVVPGTGSIDATNGDVAYNSRGWTYQEFIMSPRKLVFMNREAHWVCQCCERRESDARDMKRGKGGSFDPSQFIRSGYPDLEQLSKLLSWYNVRDLTHPEDALPAISGLLAVLSRGFEGEFLHELPERSFDISLSWRMCKDKVPNKPKRNACIPRRKPLFDCESGDPTTGALAMPSWSWTAWQGDFLSAHDEVAHVSTATEIEDEEDEGLTLAGKQFRKTSPITEWYTGSEPWSRDKCRIMSFWYVARDDVDNSDKPLPKGWVRMKASAAVKSGGAPPKYVWRPFIYQYQGAKNEQPAFWYYPFRMPDINESTPFRIPQQTRFLFCKTCKATVWLHREQAVASQWNDASLMHESWSLSVTGAKEEYPEELLLPTHPEFSVINPFNGELWPHYPEQCEEEIKPATEADEEKALIDVVAISRSSFSGRRRGRDQDPEPWRDEINILWVKWDKGVAYRLASGYIYEEDWKRLNPEEIDLVLG
jgi:hypothetical protein